MSTLKILSLQNPLIPAFQFLAIGLNQYHKAVAILFCSYWDVQKPLNFCINFNIIFYTATVALWWNINFTDGESDDDLIKQAT